MFPKLSALIAFGASLVFFAMGEGTAGIILFIAGVLLSLIELVKESH